jgi:hypothetical protein
MLTITLMRMRTKTMELDENAESLVDSHAAEQAETPESTKEQHRDRLESFDVVVAAAAIASSTSRERMGSFDHYVRDRLGSLDHPVRDLSGSFVVRERLGSFDVATAAASTLSHHHPYEMSFKVVMAPRYLPTLEEYFSP